MLDLLKGQPGVGIAGVALVLLLLAGSIIGIRAASGDFDDVYPITAEFSAIGQGVDQYSDVRLRGVPIGRVADISLTETGRARILLEIESQYELPEGTAASVEALSIFGPKFIKVDPDVAPAGAPALQPGDSIAMTTGPTELQEALDSIDGLLGAIDPDELSLVLSTSARVLEEMAPASEGFLDGTESLLDVAANRTAEGTQLLSDIRRITAELDGIGSSLSAAAAEANDVLPDLNARSAELTDVFDTTVRAANEGAALLERYPDAAADLPQGLIGAVFPPLAISSGNLDTVPDVIELLGAFFGTLGEVLHIDDPESGGRLAAVDFRIEIASLCTLGVAALCEFSQ